MVTSKKPSNGIKAASTTSPKSTPAKKTKGKGKATTASNNEPPGLVPSAIKTVLMNQLGNILYDLLKEGWRHAGPALAELLSTLSYGQFLSLARVDASVEDDTYRSEYDNWVNAQLLAAVSFNARADELGRIAADHGSSLQEIAAFAAEELIDNAGNRYSLAADDLMRRIEAFSFKCYLERTLHVPAMVIRPGPIL